MRSSLDDLGKLALRIVLALLILFHGIGKVMGGVGPISAMLAKAGMPAAFAYAAYLGEVVAPLMILFGVWTRVGALLIAINMTVALLLVHTGQFFTLSKAGGWALELQAMYFVAAVVLVLQGAGRYSLGGTAGRWN